jgi:hypothetical protein
MTPDPDALRRVLMGVTPQQSPTPQPGVRSVAALPQGPQVNLNPAMARQMALVMALRARGGQ